VEVVVEGMGLGCEGRWREEGGGWRVEGDVDNPMKDRESEALGARLR